MGRKVASISGDNRELIFLFQHISITIQRFNSILLHNSFSSDEEWTLQLFTLLLTLGIITHKESINFLGAITWSPIQGRPRSRWMENKKEMGHQKKWAFNWFLK